MFHAAKLDQRLAASFLCVHPSAQIVFDVQLEMALHLRRKIAVVSPFMKNPGHTKEPCAEPSHRCTTPSNYGTTLQTFSIAVCNGSDYSYRKATIGSTRDARRAGR